jgi:S1-C subfamily serine protease
VSPALQVDLSIVIVDQDMRRLGDGSPAPPEPSPHDEPDEVTPAPRRRRTVVAGATAVATGLAVAGWGITSAAAGGSTVAGFPRIASLASSSTPTAAVAARVERSVVDLRAKQGYLGSSDAGTGMVVTASGDVLTNNHVIRGATSITARLVSTGASYPTRVVGTDASDDIAVLRLVGAPPLVPITAGDADHLSTGTRVLAIGNALAKPGPPTVTTGRITGTKRTITAADQGPSSAGEQLTGLLATDADVISGDSGGPLADTAGQVVGMDTAVGVASGGRGLSAPPPATGFAIPITRALAIAGRIVQGRASSAVVIGTPGFLGIRTSAPILRRGGRGFGGPGWGSASHAVAPADDTGSAATVAAVLPGGPAARAGVTSGDTITAVDGHAVHDGAELFTAMSGTHGGDSVTLSWKDPAGRTHHGSSTLIAGPAA